LYNQYDLTAQVLKKTQAKVKGEYTSTWTPGRVTPCRLGAPSVSKLVIADKVVFVETQTLRAPIASEIVSGDKLSISGVDYDVISAAPVSGHHIRGTVRRCQ